VVCHPIFEELLSSPHLLLEITRAAARVVVGGSGSSLGSHGSDPHGWRSNKRRRASL
jgi:hypothetical protein